MDQELPVPHIEVCSFITQRTFEKAWRVTLVGATGRKRVVSGWLEEDSTRAIAKVASEWAALTGWPTFWMDKITITMQQMTLIPPQG